MAPNPALNLSRLKKRKEFLFVAQGKKASGRFLSLQMRESATANYQANDTMESEREATQNAKQKNQIRFGLTASKKVGNAVKRNRARRRLREALNQCLPMYGLAGHDYVAIARPQTIEAKWQELLEDIVFVLKRLSSSKTKAINPQKQ